MEAVVLCIVTKNFAVVEVLVMCVLFKNLLNSDELDNHVISTTVDILEFSLKTWIACQ